MNKINKNNIPSFLDSDIENNTILEGIKNSILLGRNSGLSITSNYNNKNVNKQLCLLLISTIIIIFLALLSNFCYSHFNNLKLTLISLN